MKDQQIPGAETTSPFPPMPMPIHVHATLGPLWDRIAMHMYAAKYHDKQIASGASAQAAEQVAIHQILTEEGAWLDVPQAYYESSGVKNDPALGRIVYAATPPAAQAATQEPCGHDYVRADSICTECGAQAAIRASDHIADATEMVGDREGMTDEQRAEVTALIAAATQVVSADRACALTDSEIEALARAIGAARAAERR